MFTDHEIEELRGLLADEGGAFWRTGDYLVRKIDHRAPGDTIDYHNGRDGIIEDAARRLDANPATLRNRYITSRCFPDGTRHSDVSWTVHRIFAQHGNGNAAPWMDQYLTTDPRPTKRRAAAWLGDKTGKQVSEGSHSGRAFAADVARHDDQAAIVTEFVAAVGPTGLAALAHAMVQNDDAVVEIIQCLEEKAGNRDDGDAPRPRPDTHRRDYGRLVESAVNSIHLALAAANAGRWEPTSRDEALLYFAARLLGDRLAPDGVGDLLPSKMHATLDEIEQYANTGGTR